MTRDTDGTNFHFHYVCPGCGHETCPTEVPTQGAWLTAAGTHAGEEHPDQWGPEPELENRPDCDFTRDL